MLRDASEGHEADGLAIEAYHSCKAAAALISERRILRVRLSECASRSVGVPGSAPRRRGTDRITCSPLHIRFAVTSPAFRIMTSRLDSVVSACFIASLRSACASRRLPPKQPLPPVPVPKRGGECVRRERWSKSAVLVEQAEAPATAAAGSGGTSFETAAKQLRIDSIMDHCLDKHE